MASYSFLAARAPRIWSPYQEAIFHDVESGDGHSVVVARAGSGKTSTIMEALRHIPGRRRVLLAAFNKSIEQELKAKAPAGIEVRTLHSHGFRLIRQAFGSAEICEDKLKRIISERFGSGLERQQIDTLRRGVSLAKNTLAETPAEVRALVGAFDLEVPEGQEDAFSGLVLELLDACANDPKRVDFDDMIWLPVRRKIRGRPYDRVFVDETQDLNRCQIELALGATAPGGRICAVGDDRQAIYAWRGADPDAVPGLIDRLRATVLPLSVTYRCARSIVELAQDVVPDLEAAPGAPEGLVAPAGWEAMEREAEPGDFILSRTNAPLVALCLGFLAQGVPANIAGRDVAAGLAALIRKSSAPNVSKLKAWIEEWGEAEAARLKARDKDPAPARDKASCLRCLADGAATVPDVLDRIDALFADRDDHDRILLSTTHKAKGLERDRVWMLEKTYKPGESVEESNLWYVAVTRAKRELRLVA